MKNLKINPKKWTLSILIFVVSILFLMGCSNGDKDLKDLTRVDVQITQSDGKYGEAFMITEQNQVNQLRVIFNEIKWDENTVPDMARKEDAKATLFLNVDKNMPEILVEYLIWFNEETGTAEVIHEDQHAYGKLDKENAQMLKGALYGNK